MKYGQFLAGMAALAAALALATPSFGAEKYAGDFLNLGSGARALGMGSAYVAVTDGAASSYYNPAGLLNLKSREASLMHSEEFGGMQNYNTLSIAAPLSETEAVGVTLLHLGVGDIPVTRLWDPSRAVSDSNRVEVAYRTDSADYALFLGGAKKVRDNLFLGATVKVLRRSIGKDTAFGYGIDLGVQYRVNQQLQVGAAFRDVTGTRVVWDVVSTADDHKTRDRIAPTLDTGAAWTDRLPWLGGKYTIAASMLYFGDSPSVKGIDTMHLGGEYWLRDILVFRGGYSEGNGTFGVGLNRLPLIASSSLDYAFLSHTSLDSTHRLSMSVRF